ncbi:MAG TPA: hypothetical protein VHZ52_07170 [Acidobacteriaceae bacterium]|jgi:hypothetical protein|nr:hypothetical protein [Acidobacteriaceae bacterium]
MNTAEHIVESYFRFCRECFTMPDRKVKGGNNRQFDLLAHKPKDDRLAHIEITVTHRLNWCYTLSDLGEDFDKKFFGVAPKRSSSGSRKTDWERGISYWHQIKETYKELGFDLSQIDRVYVCWAVKGKILETPIRTLHQPNGFDEDFEIEILSFRDVILPALTSTIATANYDDDTLRTLSFINERQRQLQL